MISLSMVLYPRQPELCDIARWPHFCRVVQALASWEVIALAASILALLIAISLPSRLRRRPRPQQGIADHVVPPSSPSWRHDQGEDVSLLTDEDVAELMALEATVRRVQDALMAVPDRIEEEETPVVHTPEWRPSEQIASGAALALLVLLAGSDCGGGIGISSSSPLPAHVGPGPKL